MPFWCDIVVLGCMFSQNCWMFHLTKAKTVMGQCEPLKHCSYSITSIILHIFRPIDDSLIARLETWGLLVYPL